jgi:putative DNA primase/helicase
MGLKKVRRPVKQESEKHIESNFTEAKKAKLLQKHTINHDIGVPPYQIKGEDLFVWSDKKERYISVSKAVKINAIKRNIETKDIQIELVFWAYDRWEYITIGRGELAKRELKKLASKGLDVLGDIQAAEVSSFLSKQEKQLKPTNVHSGIGWDIVNGQLVYKHYHIITKPSSPPIDSTYSGEYRLKPNGRKDDFFNLVIKEVRGNTPLELMICIGISALIIGMLNRSKLGTFDSLLVHLVGSTTTGKTTAGMLGVSLAGSPSPNEGLLQTYNGTKNAMARKLAGNHGVLTVLDESTMNLMDSQNLSSFVYELAQNSEKSRLNKDSELKEAQTWNTTIVSTGESSILSRANNNEGLRVRLFEFSLDNWTRSAENAENLKKGLLQNYGHVVPEIAKKMLELGPEEVAKKMEENKDDILKRMPNSKLRDRIATKFSLILTAAELFEMTYNIELSGEEIVDMLIEQEQKSMTEREMAPKFYSQFKQYLIRYRRNFKYDTQEISPHQEIWGKIEASPSETRCFILPVIFDKIVKDMGFSDTKVLLNELKKDGLIIHDKNKNQKRKFIFSRNEIKQRQEVLGQSGYAEKGDYTYCITFDGNIFEDAF